VLGTSRDSSHKQKFRHLVLVQSIVIMIRTKSNPSLHFPLKMSYENELYENKLSLRVMSKTNYIHKLLLRPVHILRVMSKTNYIHKLLLRPVHILFMKRFSTATFTLWLDGDKSEVYNKYETGFEEN